MAGARCYDELSHSAPLKLYPPAAELGRETCAVIRLYGFRISRALTKTTRYMLTGPDRQAGPDRTRPDRKRYILTDANFARP